MKTASEIHNLAIELYHLKHKGEASPKAWFSGVKEFYLEKVGKDEPKETYGTFLLIWNSLTKEYMVELCNKEYLDATEIFSS